MGQDDVLKLLKKYPKRKFKSGEINKILKYNNATSNLRRLHKQGFIKKERTGIYSNEYYYSLK